MADLNERLRVIQAILADHPKAGWDLLLDILPHEGGGIMHLSETPEWRFWAEGWKRGAGRTEYKKAQLAVVQLAVQVARDQGSRWANLVQEFGAFSGEGFDAVVAALETLTPNSLEAEARRLLWNALRERTQKQRYFRDANWAWPEDVLRRIEALRDKFEPTTSVERAIPLFGHGPDYERDPKIAYDQMMERWRLRGVNALKGVVAEEGFAGIIRLAHLVKNPGAIGFALPDVTEDYTTQILPEMLCSDDKVLREFAGAYAAFFIYKKSEDVSEAIPKETWSAEQVATYAARMLFEPRTWDFITAKGVEAESQYWKKTGAMSTTLSPKNLEFAARKLIAAGRPFHSIDLLQLNFGKSGEVSIAVLLELLEQAIITQPTETVSGMDTYALEEVVARLQNTPGLDEARLAKVEWALLPLLNRGGHHRPGTLHKLLSKDPSFLIDLLKILYRPHSSPKPEKNPSEAEAEDNEAAARKRQAERAWELLHEWKTLPGRREDGVIDSGEINKWFEAGRAMATECDRLIVFDITVGELFASAPAEKDGSWPCVPIRDLLEKTDSVELLRGFATGIHNSRGVHWRNPKEGGRQERDLAGKYEKFAELCRAGWPHVSTALKKVADEYRDWARIEDARAESEK